MQTAINIFTIIGSLIGIISLLMTMFSSIHNYNTKKWEKLSSIISLNEFEELYNGVGIGIIPPEESDKLSILLYNIRKKSEIVQFKGFSKKKIEKKFSEILVESNKFYDEVQTPRWKGKNIDEINVQRVIDKEYFNSEYKLPTEHGKAIDNSINNAREPIDKIKKLYREIYSLTNKLPYEFIFK